MCGITWSRTHIVTIGTKAWLKNRALEILCTIIGICAVAWDKEFFGAWLCYEISEINGTII